MPLLVLMLLAALAVADDECVPQDMYSLLQTRVSLSRARESQLGNHPGNGWWHNISTVKPTILRRFPHDYRCFTQGLLIRDGFFLESCGVEGFSNLRELVITQGTLQRKLPLAQDIFAEGLAMLPDDHIVQLTWKNHKAFVYRAIDFKLLHTHEYQGEGWGLCYDEASGLLAMSDGSATIAFRDPSTFAEVHKVIVTRGGQPVHNLNELECVGEHIYANVFLVDEIVRIDRRTGVVDCIVDAGGLLNATDMKFLNSKTDVLNGIAFDSTTNLLYVTGKRWRWMFEVDLGVCGAQKPISVILTEPQDAPKQQSLLLPELSPPELPRTSRPPDHLLTFGPPEIPQTFGPHLWTTGPPDLLPTFGPPELPQTFGPHLWTTGPPDLLWNDPNNLSYKCMRPNVGMISTEFNPSFWALAVTVAVFLAAWWGAQAPLSLNEATDDKEPEPMPVLDAAICIETLPVGLAKEPTFAPELHWSGAPCNIGTAPGLCLDVMVASAALATPEYPALLNATSGAVMTYMELERCADAAAAALRVLDVPLRFCGLMIERDTQMVVGLLGILKAGAAYVPLDPRLPDGRLQHMLQDMGASTIIVTVAQWVARAAHLGGGMLIMDLSEVGSGSNDIALPERSPDDSCYLLYTSGSTGRPKGVELTHRAVSTMISHALARKWIQVGDLVLQSTPLAFDPAGIEIWTTLAASATLLLPRHDALHDLPGLWSTIDQHRPNFVQLVPSVCSLLIAEAGVPGNPRWIACGGEPLPVHLWARLRADAGSQGLLNFYGPTEVSINSTDFGDRDGDRQLELAVHTFVPLGRPSLHRECYIMDSDGRLCSDGSHGELWIAGAGLARGYLNLPEKTTQAFVPHPFCKGQRAFRTGDLVRWLPTGHLQYLGRRDHQVKLNGVRIELGELENVAREAPGVHEAAVVLHHGTEKDEGSCLVAYVSPASVDVDAVLALFHSRLPSTMVPKTVVPLDNWPRTAGGKIHRQRLPTPPQTSLTENIIDSLGVVRQASRDAAFAISCLQCLYLSAIVPQILDHWIKACSTTLYESPGLKEMLSKDEWMNAFYFGFGAMEGLRNTKPSLGAREVWLVALYATWPFWVLQVCGTIAWLISGGVGYVTETSITRSIFTGLRWFIGWILLAKLLLIVTSGLQRWLVSTLGTTAQKQGLKAGSFVTILVIFFSWVAGSHQFGIFQGVGTCNGWLTLGDNIRPWVVSFKCSVPYQMFTGSLCTFGFFVGAPSLRALRTTLPKSILTRTFVYVTALVVAMTLLVWPDQSLRMKAFGLYCHARELCMPQEIPSRMFCTWQSAIEFSCVVVQQFLQVCSLALACAGLPKIAASLGEHCLTAYVTHCAFAPLFMSHGLNFFGWPIIPGLSAVLPRSQIAQVCLAWVYAIAFVALVAQPLTLLFGASIRGLNRAVTCIVKEKEFKSGWKVLKVPHSNGHYYKLSEGPRGNRHRTKHEAEAVGFDEDDE